MNEYERISTKSKLSGDGEEGGEGGQVVRTSSREVVQEQRRLLKTIELSSPTSGGEQ